MPFPISYYRIIAKCQEKINAKISLFAQKSANGAKNAPLALESLRQKTYMVQDSSFGSHFFRHRKNKNSDPRKHSSMHMAIHAP